LNQRDEQAESLNALRFVAMLLGVLLHALIPYMTVPVPHLLWPVREPASCAFDTLYWFLHGFRVPLFFVIAGMTAGKILPLRATREFFLRRLRRLGVPLLIGTFTVLPLMYIVWSWGWLKSGLADPGNVVHIRFRHGMQADLYGFGHLWFLVHLILYSLLLSAYETSRLRVAFDKHHSWIWILIPFPTAALLWIDPRPLTEFHHWFFPRAAEFVYHGWFFAVGAWAVRVPAWVIRWWLAGVATALVAFLFMHSQLVRAATPSGPWLAISASLFAWAGVWGLLGFFARIRAGRWATDAALFIYLVHPPLVGVFHVLLFRAALAPGWKAVITASLSCLIGAIVFVIMKTTLRHVGSSLPATPALRPIDSRTPSV